MKSAKNELRRVLEMLPTEDQRQITECWKRLCDGSPTLHVLPKDELLRIGVRWAGTNGVTFYFREELFSCSSSIPVAVLDAAVAHELAHSFFAMEERAMRVAEYLRTLTTRVGMGLESIVSRAMRKVHECTRTQIQTDFAEGKAWLKAEEWGFKQAEALVWLRENLP